MVTTEAGEAAARLGLSLERDSGPDGRPGAEAAGAEPEYARADADAGPRLEPAGETLVSEGVRLHITPRSDAVISGGKVVLPGQGILPLDLVIHDGKVAALGEGLSSDGLELDASGLITMPGIFDPHVHLGLFAPMEEELRTEGNAALLGGITTIGWFIGGRGSHLQRLKDIGACVDRLSPVDVVPHLVISDERQIEEIPQYIACGVNSFKVYMCGIPDLIDPVSDAFLADLFEALSPYGSRCVVCVHAENASLVDRALRFLSQGAEEVDLERWAETHPALAEEEAIQRAALLSRESGVRVYFVHISSAAGLEAVSRARAGDTGRRLLAETTSPYLANPPTGDSEPLGKMVPPLRGRATADALWRALEEGIIDSIGTDNVTMTREEKGVERPLTEVLPGYPVLGVHLPLLLEEGYHRRGIGLMKIVDAVTRRPAQIFGLYPEKGTLLPGSVADCVVVDLDESRRVRAGELGSRSDFSPVQDRALRGWPVMTMKSGKVAALFRGQRETVSGRLLLGADDR